MGCTTLTRLSGEMYFTPVLNCRPVRRRAFCRLPATLGLGGRQCCWRPRHGGTPKFGIGGAVVLPAGFAVQARKISTLVKRHQFPSCKFCLAMFPAAPSARTAQTYSAFGTILGFLYS